jgi:membrane-associated phospholipid phosphatase
MNYTKPKKIFKSPKFWIGLLALVGISQFDLLMSSLIQNLFPNRLPIIDTLFLITPQIMWTQYLTDTAVLVSIAILLYYIIKNDYLYFPYYFTVFAFGYLLRGIFIILNPVGSVLGNLTHYGLTNVLQHGMFPSGHVMLVFIAYYISNGIMPKYFRAILFLICLVEIISLILSRGHYSIDIVGGFLLAYFVVTEIKKRKQTLVL